MQSILHWVEILSREKSEIKLSTIKHHLSTIAIILVLVIMQVVDFIEGQIRYIMSTFNSFNYLDDYSPFSCLVDNLWITQTPGGGGGLVRCIKY